jgi:hypothetical protein
MSHQNFLLALLLSSGVKVPNFRVAFAWRDGGADAPLPTSRLPNVALESSAEMPLVRITKNRGILGLQR